MSANRAKVDGRGTSYGAEVRLQFGDLRPVDVEVFDGLLPFTGFAHLSKSSQLKANPAEYEVPPGAWRHPQ